MVWGIRGDELVLVKKDAHDKLIFNQLIPSYQLGNLNEMPLIPSNHKGKAIVVKHGKVDQHGHGMIQHLEIGNESEAMSIFIDKNNHMLWLDCPSLAFDAYNHHEAKAYYLFTSHTEYPH